MVALSATGGVIAHRRHTTRPRCHPVEAGGTGSSSAIEISGAATGKISKPGGCGKAIRDDSGWEVTFATDKPGWMLDATIEGDEGAWHVSDRFPSGGRRDGPALSGGAAASYDSSAGTGSITVDEGANSGSIDATVTDATTGKTARAVGGWTWENWD